MNRLIEPHRIPINTFFRYFGAKCRSAKFYSPPKYPVIIEPFAGSAGYSINYSNWRVKLYDASEVICGVWDYLIHASEKEILKLSITARHVNDLKCCQEAKWLIGFWWKMGSPNPARSVCDIVSKYPKHFWSAETRARIARQVQFIRHWTITCCDYQKVPNERATWFIDPPYNNGKVGNCYSSNVQFFHDLAKFCKERIGQVIVCDMQGATWLPFKPLGKMQTKDGHRCQEVVYEQTG